MCDKKDFDLENYWQDVEDKNQTSRDFKEEFSENTYQVGMAEKSRRDFLKIMGFSLSVLPLASSCKKITAEKAIPYLHKNDQIVPGVANWYATTCEGCHAHCSLLVKTREGRPIKIEGNPLSKKSLGGTCPIGQASVLSLYDSFRYSGPKIGDVDSTFDNAITKIKKALSSAKLNGKKTAFITSTHFGPTKSTLIEEFKSFYPNVEIISYSPNCVSSIYEANKLVFGSYDGFNFDLSKANLIVGVNADFLGGYLNPVNFSKQYSSRKDLFQDKNIIKHIQVESMMSLTGSNADDRFMIESSEEGLFLNNLLSFIQKYSGKSVQSTNLKEFPKNDIVEKIAGELLSHKGKSVVVCGSDFVDHQVLVNAINTALENFGNTIFVSNKNYAKAESDLEFKNFVKNISAYEVVMFSNVNPVFDFYDSEKLKKGLEQVKVKVSFNTSPDETSTLCNIVVPDKHSFEKWNDFEIDNGVFSFSQPLIDPLFNSVQVEETILHLIDKKMSFYDYQRSVWQNKLLPKFNSGFGFSVFWDKAIHDGYVDFNLEKNLNVSYKPTNFDIQNFKDELSLITYEKVAIKNGSHVTNPWLLELPDPITKMTWDNYLMISPSLAKSKNLETSDVVTVKSENNTFELPVLVQPGMAKNTMAVAVGFGRSISGKAGKNVGVNVYPISKGINLNVSITKLNKKHKMAQTQTHHSMEGRNIVKETDLKSFLMDPASGNKDKVKLVSMWKDYEKGDHHWAMMIDLNKCNGCSGCIVSCNAENNVPVVGKDEVFNRREMHWLRLDRYYKGDDENPSVVHQPVMCMHCENAPCETVCPVVATTHSSDGLNQQVYNRCVGTRYCANNCPYKVRRFNWFDYAHDDKYENMVLNPDIVVRTRGVMEKCSMCIQRIQEAKLEAKKQGRDVADGEIKLACQQSCHSDAIIFGDINDPKSVISKRLKDPRYYRVLEELNVAPRVGFLTKVRNK